MRRFVIFLALVCAAGLGLFTLWGSGLPGAAAREKDDKAETQKKELAALQGTWKLIHHEEDGKEVPYEDAQLYTIEEQKITVKKKDEVIVEGDLKLDASTSPMQLDFQFTSGQTDLTIYVRAGGYLIQCGHRDGKTRPKEFATGTGEGGAYVIVLKRQK
jgi:uncharacterized protein (TIGR03067 family)